MVDFKQWVNDATKSVTDYGDAAKNYVQSYIDRASPSPKPTPTPAVDTAPKPGPKAPVADGQPAAPKAPQGLDYRTGELRAVPEGEPTKPVSGAVAAGAAGEMPTDVGQLIKSKASPEALAGALAKMHTLGTAVSDTDNFAKSIEQVTDHLSLLPTEQQEQFTKAFAKAGVNPAVVNEVKAAAVRKGIEVKKGVSEALKQNPKNMGFTDFLKDNWQSLLLPAGIAMMFFKGSVPKLLGMLAMGMGGYNLARRYQNLAGKNKTALATKKALQSALTYKDPETGEAKPFGNIEAFKNNPDVYQGLRDAQWLIHSGFHDMVQRNVASGAGDTVGLMYGPDAAKQVTQAVQQGRAPMSVGGAIEGVQRGFKAPIDVASRAMNTARGWLPEWGK